MKTQKQVAQFIHEAVEDLTEWPESIGKYMVLDGSNNYDDAWAVVVLWVDGWGNERRDDAIQDPNNLDWGLEVRIAKTNLSESVDVWLMFSDKEDIIVDGIGIRPIDKKDNYMSLAKSILEDYDYIKEQDDIEYSELPTTIKTRKIRENKNTLPSSVVISREKLNVPENLELEFLFLHDNIADRLEEDYKCVPQGFEYLAVNDAVQVSKIVWQEDIPLKESQVLTENTGNFGTNNFINLCSHHFQPEDFPDEFEYLRAEYTEMSEEQIEAHVYDMIDNFISDDFERIEKLISENDVENIVFVKPGYFDGFYIDFYFDSAEDLVSEITYYNDCREDAVDAFNKAVDGIIKTLTSAVDMSCLVRYDVAYRLDNGGMEYTLDENAEETIEDIKEVFEKVREEGLAYIESSEDFEDCDINESTRARKRPNSKLKESQVLAESTGNFGISNFINLCSREFTLKDFKDDISSLKEEEPDITEKEIYEHVYLWVDDIYTSNYEEIYAKISSTNIKKLVELEPGYYIGFYFKFKFKSIEDFVEIVTDYAESKEEATRMFVDAVNTLKTFLEDVVVENEIVLFDIARKYSNGETEYNFADKATTLRAINMKSKELLKQGKDFIKEHADEYSNYD